MTKKIQRDFPKFKQTGWQTMHKENGQPLVSLSDALIERHKRVMGVD